MLIKLLYLIKQQREVTHICRYNKQKTYDLHSASVLLIIILLFTNYHLSAIINIYTVISWFAKEFTTVDCVPIVSFIFT